MQAWRPPRRWMLALGTIAALYMALLLGDAHRSQQQLRAEAETRVLADNRQAAAVLSDFLQGQQESASELARSHEIEVFLANRALGMSMRYGLAASLFDIEQALRQRLAAKTAMGVPVFRRILYLDEDGTVLADTATGQAAPAWPRQPVPAPQQLIDDREALVVSAAPVRLRGVPAGQVVAVSDAGLLLRFLATAGGELGYTQLLVFDSGRSLSASAAGAGLDGLKVAQLTTLAAGRLLPVSALAPSDAGEPGRAYDLAVRMPVAGSPLSLVTLLPESVAFGHIRPRLLLLLAAALPLALAVLGGWLLRVGRRNRRLEADVRESDRRRSELKHRNDALTVEIDRRESLERELRESEQRYRTYIEHAPEGIFVLSVEGRIVDVNPSACSLVGYSRAELLGMSSTDLAPPGMAHRHAALLMAAVRGGRVENEGVLRRKDGSDRVADLRAIALPNGLVMGFCVDITERKQAEQQIRRLAYFDPLTALPNRRLLMDRLRRAMAASARSREFGALLLLDLDRFKDLNDTQGHDVGDRLLVEVARRLGATMRSQDTVARLGGDEYVVVVEGLGTEEDLAAKHAEAIAGKAHAALGQPCVLSEGRPPYHGTPSIGVTLFRGEEPALDTLLKQADVALYQAKGAGRNTIRFFNPEVQAALDARSALESDLRRGLRNDEFRLHFQPQVDREGRIVGAEALLRWCPPDAAPVPPARFVPVAEETGLIVALGAWVLDQACTQLQRWQSMPGCSALSLSINVSARQFHEPDFVASVLAAVERSGIEPSRLRLELTESLVLERVDEVIARMRQLERHGVGFSLDDFGTGYSSLAYLKRLPLQEVKIDKSFMRDLTHDPNDAAIVRAVLAMSHSLGLSVVAEGVETPAQLAFLKRHGCERYQGYLFGRPVPIEQWPAAVAAEGPRADAPAHAC